MGFKVSTKVDCLCSETAPSFSEVSFVVISVAANIKGGLRTKAENLGITLFRCIKQTINLRRHTGSSADVYGR